MGDPVRLSLDDGAAVLTLDRPLEGNRLGLDMCAALDDATRQLASASGLRAVLIRAEGRQFCVGGSIDEFMSKGPIVDYLAGILPVGHKALLRLASLPCPVISAIQGPVAGAGIAVALCADLVLAGSSMVLRAGYPRLGLSSDFGVSWFLDTLAGPRAASDILLTNRTVPAAECVALGLVTRLCDDDELDSEARALLAQMAQAPTRAMMGLKRLVAGRRLADLAAHLDAERDLMLACGRTRDAAEGVTAFRERRMPVFEGR